MPVGMKVYNSAGVPQVIDFSRNLVLRNQGTVTVGSNTSATGTTGYVALTPSTLDYLVFISTNGGNAHIEQSTNGGFSWFMAQGTTSFSWWAYSNSTSVSSAGMQVYNSDGSLRWDIGQRPLQFEGVITTGWSPPYEGEFTSSNILVNTATYTVPTGMCYLMSDMGYLLDLYTGYPGYTILPNMRHWPCINNNGTTLRINYGRKYPDRGTLPSGMNYNTYTGKPPNFIFYTKQV